MVLNGELLPTCELHSFFTCVPILAIVFVAMQYTFSDAGIISTTTLRLAPYQIINPHANRISTVILKLEGLKCTYRAAIAAAVVVNAGAS